MQECDDIILQGVGRGFSGFSKLPGRVVIVRLAGHVLSGCTGLGFFFIGGRLIQFGTCKLSVLGGGVRLDEPFMERVEPASICATAVCGGVVPTQTHVLLATHCQR